MNSNQLGALQKLLESYEDAADASRLTTEMILNCPSDQYSEQLLMMGRYEAWTKAASQLRRLIPLLKSNSFTVEQVAA